MPAGAWPGDIGLGADVREIYRARSKFLGLLDAALSGR
jgi:hypothetical protein